MKYMGSKRAMLTNGLGDILRGQVTGRQRFVDLFCGAASVSWFAAEELGLPVLALDLQEYAVVLARSVIGRTAALDAEGVAEEWVDKVEDTRESYGASSEVAELDSAGLNTATWRKRAQALCGSVEDMSLSVLRAYGGHYFSPTQALTIDAMMACLPKADPHRSVCLAATIVAASKCAASPGHTAQPFKATRTAGRFLREAWLRNPITYARQSLTEICPKYAVKCGEARRGAAVASLQELRPTDLVFIDPPYSGVHYSRFYHVLETVARGDCGHVAGVGRYPPRSERPASSFSRRGESQEALKSLLEGLSSVECTAVFTFPAGECSNGLSGEIVKAEAQKCFKVSSTVVNGRFSTLGGNNGHRAARQDSRELILVLSPR